MDSHEGAQARLAVAPDLVIEYLVQGQGMPLVILPSLGRGAADYDALAAALADAGLRVIRPQPRGIGRSRGAMAGLSMHDLAADVALVIAQEVGGPVHVVGHAFGNFVARALATDCPELVTALCLLAASAGKLPSGESPYAPEVWEAIFKSGDMSLPQEQRRGYLQCAFFAPGNDPSPWLAGWHAEAKAAQAHALATTPIDHYYAAGQAPILHLQATCDAVAPLKHGYLLKDSLGPRVEVEFIEKAGHALVPEQPEAVKAALLRWCRAGAGNLPVG